MRWNLRLAAANRGIWKASELQRMLAEHDLKISAGKMSGLWSGEPASIKLADLDVICAVLGCGVEDLLIPGPDKVQRPEEPSRPSRVEPSPGPGVILYGIVISETWCDCCTVLDVHSRHYVSKSAFENYVSLRLGSAVYETLMW
jgi:DNA-binding Xre family transcriptional regulator